MGRTQPIVNIAYKKNRGGHNLDFPAECCSRALDVELYNYFIHLVSLFDEAEQGERRNFVRFDAPCHGFARTREHRAAGENLKFWQAVPCKPRLRLARGTA
jgi:hypothetical protein